MIYYLEAKIKFPNNKIKILDFAGDRKFIYKQIMFYHNNKCEIETRPKWFEN